MKNKKINYYFMMKTKMKKIMKILMKKKKMR